MQVTFFQRAKNSLKRRLGFPRKYVARGPFLVDDHLVQSVPHLFEAHPNKKEQFARIWDEYRERHGQPWDPIRILQFMYLMDIASQAGTGDYIELGTHQGLMAKVIYKLMDPKRTLYCLDTFEGFVESDLKVESTIYHSTWQVGNFAPTSPEMVGNYIGDGKTPKNLKLVKGWFPQTFAGLEDKKWLFVHIDFDLYQPIKSAMELLWPNLLPGGVMVIHDYGCFGFPGAKKAVDEFFETIGLTPMNLGDRWGSVAVIKPKISMQS